MSVQSLSYFAFVIVAWIAAFLLRSSRARQVLLLLVSYLFYASWGLEFLAILFVSSIFNYTWGGVLRRHPTSTRLWIGIVANLALLALYKYVPAMGFVFPSTSPLAPVLSRLIMPVGISFWTFQAISYLLDTYRGEDEVPSLIEFCLYLAFWPTVLSGPICRLGEMLPQFRRVSSLEWDDISVGVRRIVIGLFMKVVLAGTLADGLNPGEGVNDGFDKIVSGWSGVDVWLLAIGFGFQLFFDFAGYSHIVIGTSRLFGIRLQENFNRPYLSQTTSSFWTRWHMSLSFWIRDYIFLTLAAQRRNQWWRNLALVISMTLFGLWHGASATFVCWGAYHGLLLVAHRQIQELRRRSARRIPQLVLPSMLGAGIAWGVTFAFVSIGWILFRSNSLGQAVTMMGQVVSPASYLHLTLRPNFYIITTAIIISYFALVGLERISGFLQRSSVVSRSLQLLSPVWYATAIFFIIVWSQQKSLFVYFQF